MAESAGGKRCSKPGCEVATSGLCAEGHEPLEACPSYGHELAEAPGEEKKDGSLETLESRTVEHSESLPTGEVLNTEGMDEFLRWRPASRIAIIGDSDSGKTTLICSIYGQFLRGPFADYFFAGSRTLVAFEKRSHLSRTDSGRIDPDTERTSISDGLRFYHLAVICKGRNDERSDLMFSDRAGEMYRRARDNTDGVQELVEIAQSDRVVLLLDGGRVAISAERAGAIQSVRQMLRAFVDGGALGPASKVQIVTTKIDLLVDNADKQAIDSQLAIFRKKLVDDFGGRLADLSFWEISARDPAGKFKPAHGVEELFADWATRRTKMASRSTLKISLLTEFDKLLLRTPMEVLP